MASISISGIDQVTTLQAKIARAIFGVPQEVRRVNRSFAPIVLQTLVQHSSGRPGPQVVSGAYNAAYVVQVTDNEFGLEASNSSPQSNRLEYGFVGVDALGRHYAQPPLPHFRPTLDIVGPRYAAAISDAFPRWWG